MPSWENPQETCNPRERWRPGPSLLCTIPKPVKATPMQRHNQIAALAAVLAYAIASGGGAAAQPVSPPTVPATTAPGTSAGIPPCPTLAEQKAAMGKKSTTGSEVAAVQPAERSGVLPSASGPGIKASAAPTVQGDSGSQRSAVDCVLIPEHPNAIQPGPNEGAPTPSPKP
jgi:hypothetical protein